MKTTTLPPPTEAARPAGTEFSRREPAEQVDRVSARLRTVIVDDEPTARRGVRLLLERDRGIDIVGEAAGGAEAAELIKREKPDLVFLDVQMPGCDGFAALEKVGGAAAPVIVFVTAYDEHALRAFEVNAVDYLLKPYDDARFAAALQRAKDEVRRRQADSVNSRLTQLLDYLQHDGVRPIPAKEESASDRILVKSSGEIFFLKAEEIDWIEAEGDYMKFHVGGRAHLMRETMARLESRLDPKRFIRIHRSTIVNIDRLRKLSPSFAGEYAVILHDGTKLKLSRGYHERIATLMKQAL
jgi:two-component system LytT family response regulator